MKETLRILREKNHLSQAAVAEYLGISRLMYLKYESGENEPTVKMVKLLSQLYKTSYKTIIDNELYTAKSDYNISSPTPSYSAGKIHPLNESALSSIYLRKFELLTEEQKEIVGNLVNSLFSMNSKGKKSESKHVREPGGLNGKFFMADDFDETPDVFKEYM